jgi:nucleotide-binding universal stress UspA family protein
MYEMLTGHLPHGHSKKLSRVRDRLKKDPIPPRYYDRSIPPSIQEIILKSLATIPEQRYRSIADFISALKNHTSLQTTVLGELVTKPLPFVWFFTFTGCSRIVEDSDEEAPVRTTTDRQILGCIIDHEYSDLVIEQIKREVLLRGGEITLLAVTDEEQDDGLVKYAVEVEGKSFSKRLDNYIATLKRYDLEPILRIRKGDAAEVIIDIAGQLKADTIIMGPPRPKKGLSGIFGGSTIEKVIKHSDSTIVIADAVSPAAPPFFCHQDELTPGLLAEIDLFLTDTWVKHLNWFSETAHGLLDGSTLSGPHDETTCHFGTWLARILQEHDSQESNWAKLTALVAEPHKQFHLAIMHMTEAAENDDIPAMVKLYHEKALPQSVAFRKGLQEISRQLRAQQQKLFDPDSR